MERTVNFRPLFYLFLAFALGIAFAYYIFNLNFVVNALAIVLALAVFILSALNKKWKPMIAVFLAFVVGLGVFSIDYYSYINKDFRGEICSVTGRVDEFVESSSNFSYATLINVKINGYSTKNLSLGILTSGDSACFEEGDILSCEAEVYSIKLFENGSMNSYQYKKNVAYTSSVATAEINCVSGNKTVAETIRHYIKDILDSNMGEKIAPLAYSALFGDKTELGQTLKDDFSISGVAHLLAVSGLHIGFLVAILYWLLKRFNVNGLPRFIVVAVFLLFYSYLCDFTPSVIRASLMCITFLALGLFGRQYDLMSSIGLSGILILMIKPLYVFDAGFLMSFCSVLAIAMLYKVFAKAFMKIKIPKGVAEAVAIDISTTIAIAPILAIFFGNLSFLSFVTNLICIPVFTVAYSLLFILVAITCVFRFLGFLLFIPEIMFKFIVMVVEFIASLEWSVISLHILGTMGLFMFYVLLFILSPMLMLKAGKKFVLALCVIVIGSAYTSAFAFAPLPDKNTYTQLNSYSICAVITSKGGETFVISDMGDMGYLDEYLTYNRVSKVDALFVLGVRNDAVEEFEEKYKVKTLMFKTFGEKEVGDFCVESFNLGSEDLKAVLVEVDGTCFLFGVENIGTSQARNLSEKISSKNVVSIFQARNYGFYETQNANYLLSRDKINTYDLENYSTKVRGSFKFEFNNATIGNIKNVK